MLPCTDSLCCIVCCTWYGHAKASNCLMVLQEKDQEGGGGDLQRNLNWFDLICIGIGERNSYNRGLVCHVECPGTIEGHKLPQIHEI